MKQRRKFNATPEEPVRYYVCGLDEPNALEDLALVEGLPDEAVESIRADARAIGSLCAVLGFSGGRAETVVLPQNASSRMAFDAIAERFGTRFDPEQIAFSPRLAKGIDALIAANFHRAPEAVQ